MVIMYVFNIQPHEAYVLMCGKTCREEESCGSLS